jgi:hypothetical protein
VARAPLAALSPVDRVRALARERGCSILDAAEDGDRIRIGGLAVRGLGWDRFLARAQESGGTVPVAATVDFLPPFACQVVEVVGAAVRASRAAPDGGPIAAAGIGHVVAGGTLALRKGLAPPVTVDLYQPDGMVIHVPVRVAAGGGRTEALLPPFSGREGRVAVVLAGARTQDMGSRPGAEPTGVYLAALGRELETDHDIRADMVVLEPGTFAPVAPVGPVARGRRPIAPIAAPIPVLPRAERCERVRERGRPGEFGHGRGGCR